MSAATLREKLQIKLLVSPSHSILTPGRPASELSAEHLASGRVVTGEPNLKPLVFVSV